MSVDEVEGSLAQIQSLTDTDVRQRDVVGLAALRKSCIRKPPSSDAMLGKVIRTPIVAGPACSAGSVVSRRRVPVHSGLCKQHNQFQFAVDYTCAGARAASTSSERAVAALEACHPVPAVGRTPCPRCSSTCHCGERHSKGSR